MELRQLRYFVRIVELGSMTRAAADLFIAQPALSQQLASLEHELGVRLLSRSYRGVTPTEQGEVFYRHAQSMLRMMERLRSDVQQVGDQPTGVVSIGMPTSVANVLAAPLVTEAHARYPGIRLQISEGLSGYLKELVVNGRVQMSVLFDVSDASNDAGKRTSFSSSASSLRVTPMLQEELFLLRAGQRRFGKGVSLMQASQHALILPAASIAVGAKDIADVVGVQHEGCPVLLDDGLDEFECEIGVGAAGIPIHLYLVVAHVHVSCFPVFLHSCVGGRGLARPEMGVNAV